MCELNHQTLTELNPSTPIQFPHWKVVKVQPLAGYKLAVEFFDGLSSEVDLSTRILNEQANEFAVLRDYALFNQAYIACCRIRWPGNSALELDSEKLHDEMS